MVVLLFLPSAGSRLPWAPGVGLALNFWGGTGFEAGPLGDLPPTLAAAANGTSARNAFTCVQHAEGRTAGGAVGAQLGRLIWLHPKPWANRTDHPGLLLSSGPGGPDTARGTCMCRSHCSVTNYSPGLRPHSRLGSLDCQRETTWVGTEDWTKRPLYGVASGTVCLPKSCGSGLSDQREESEFPTDV